MNSFPDFFRVFWSFAGKNIRIAHRKGGARILYLEEDRNIRTAVARSIVQMGYTVVEAGAMEQGLAHAEDRSIDLFLLNVSLLDRWGIEFCRQARSLDRDIPIFFFSTEVGRLHRIDAAVPEYFLKPSAFNELQSTLARLIEESRAGEIARHDSLAKLRKAFAQKAALAG